MTPGEQRSGRLRSGRRRTGAVPEDVLPSHAPSTEVVPTQVDAVIVGGGAAGLSLACHLAAGTWRGREVLVVDDGAHRPTDRAWAYWSTGGGLLDAAAHVTFDRIGIRTADGARDLRLGRYRYRAVGGEGLDQAATRLLAHAPGFRRVRGTVREIREDGGGAVVSLETDDDAAPGGTAPASAAPASTGAARLATVRAAWVFDSVGIGGPLPDPEGSLAFLGYRVETGADTFDPATPTLMDFRTDQTRGLAFVYVLPESPRVALVEHTRFVVRDHGGPSRESPRSPTASGARDVDGAPPVGSVASANARPAPQRFAHGATDHRTRERRAPERGASKGASKGASEGAAPDHRASDDRALVSYLDHVLGIADRRILPVEQGTIPLATRPAQRPTAHVVPIGAPAGMVKASTGYGYGRIQRHSAAIARSLAAHGHPFDVPGPSRRHPFMDALLLDVIRDEPAAALRIVARMFARNRPDRVLAFLDEDTTPLQELALILTLPPAPFLRALAHRVRRRRRRAP